MGATTVIAAAAVTSAAVGIGSTVYGMTQSSSPPPPPKPANYYNYGADGTVTEQIWDSSQNAYITKVNPEPEKPQDVQNYESAFAKYNQDMADWQKNYPNGDNASNTFNVRIPGGPAKPTAPTKPANYDQELADWQKQYDTWQAQQDQQAKDKATINKLRDQYLSNLSQTPEDRLKAYDDYAKAVSDTMHASVDPQFVQDNQQIQENMNARGMTGSRAYVDTMSQFEKDKLASDTNIANYAAQAKESLAQNDRNYWLNALDQIDSGQRADAALTTQQEGQAMQGAQMGTAALVGAYGAQLNANNQRAQGYEALGNTAVNTATGLAYLYGYRNPGSKLGGTGSGGGSPTAYSPDKYTLNY